MLIKFLLFFIIILTFPTELCAQNNSCNKSEIVLTNIYKSKYIKFSTFNDLMLNNKVEVYVKPDTREVLLVTTFYRQGEYYTCILNVGIIF